VHRIDVINFVEKNGPCRKCDIIKFILAIKGRAYDPIKDRGYYCDAFWRASGWCKEDMVTQHKYGYLTYPVASDCRYLKKNNDGLWAVVRGNVKA